MKRIENNCENYIGKVATKLQEQKIKLSILNMKYLNSLKARAYTGC